MSKEQQMSQRTSIGHTGCYSCIWYISSAQGYEPDCLWMTTNFLSGVHDRESKDILSYLSCVMFMRMYKT